MISLVKNIEGNFTILVDNYPTFVCAEKYVVRSLQSLNVQEKEGKLALEWMDKYKHNQAYFGINKTICFTSNT